MESRAIKRYIGSSPRKMRLVVDLIRNKSVEESLAILRFSKKQPAVEVEKTVRSAYNNLVNLHDTGRINMDEVFVKEAFVDVGPTMKRMLPAPQGRAFRIRKRSAHLTVVVNYEEPATKAAPRTPKVKEQQPEETPNEVATETVAAAEPTTEKKPRAARTTKKATGEKTQVKETKTKKAATKSKTSDTKEKKTKSKNKKETD